MQMLSNKLATSADRLRHGENLGGGRACSMRTFIRDTKCFCTHECNTSINLLFNPAAYPKIGREMIREWMAPNQPEDFGASAANASGGKVAPMTDRVPVLPGDANGPNTADMKQPATAPADTRV